MSADLSPLPRDIFKLSAAVQDALNTRAGSVTFAALLWRNLSEACLDGKPAVERREREQKALREVLTSLGSKAAGWHRAAVQERLAVHAAHRNAPRPRFYRAMMSKALRPFPNWAALEIDVFRERIRRQDLKGSLDDFLERHPLALGYRIFILAPVGTKLTKATPTGRFSPGAVFHLDVFDLLLTGPKLSVAISWGEAGKQKSGTIELPANCELAWIDLVSLAAGQLLPESNKAGLQRNHLEAEILWLPRVRKHLESEQDPALRRKLMWWLADFWTF